MKLVCLQTFTVLVRNGFDLGKEILAGGHISRGSQSNFPLRGEFLGRDWWLAGVTGVRHTHYFSYPGAANYREKLVSPVTSAMRKTFLVPLGEFFSS